MPLGRSLVAGCSLLVLGCGGGNQAGIDSGVTGADAESADASSGTRPHPLYPALDLDALPGGGGAAVGAYQVPTLPATTRSITITTVGDQARSDLLAACQVSGTAVTVPDGAGRLGVLDLGDVQDCDIQLGHAVIVDLVFVGHLPGPVVAPSHRVRVRGGRLGNIIVDPGSTDIVFDGVTLDTGIFTAVNRPGVGIYLQSNAGAIVERFAFVNSVLRMLPTEPDGSGNIDGCAYLASMARDVFFANDNVVTAGNRNSWGFRIGGGENFIIADSSVRVSFHKLIRMNDGPVDYVYVAGGRWMREATLTAGGVELNDSFTQLDDLGTDSVFIHDPEVHLLSAEPVSFGMSTGPGQAGKSWEARRIQWHARSAAVISDQALSSAAGGCDAAASCDYGVGTHSYNYDDNLTFPVDPWRVLPDLPEDDPDAL